MRPARSLVALSVSLAVAGCGGGSEAGGVPPPPSTSLAHSSSIALGADGRTLVVANPESDSVSVLDVASRALVREILLAAAPPAPDPTTGAFVPAVMPRSLALSPDGATLYVSGERSGALHVVDVASGTVRTSVKVGSEPVGVLASADGATLWVACSQDATVVRVDAASGAVTGSVAVPSEPWALGWSGESGRLLVTHLLGPGVTAIDPATLEVVSTWPLDDVAPRGDKRLAHGQPRGLYDVAARPGTREIFVAHTLLGTDTPQPALDFESTAFPSLALFDEAGKHERTLTTDATDVPGIDGAFGDVISGPHAIAFTRDGAFALVADANSEDILVVDAEKRVESSLVRPLPGKMPDGIVVSPDGTRAYVDERMSGDVAVLRLDRSNGTLAVSVDGAPIARWTSDPMPPTLRFGAQLFQSANSTEYPITTDHWIACATCHMEGRSDAVTWRFAQGPRDTPSNAGGMLGTGFLFRTADRNKVQDYWRTINVEQGGHFDAVAQSSLLDAITAYVNAAIPLPIPPTTDAALVARGAEVFQASGCATCHAGARFTDSGAGNEALDLGGPVVLHDVGTCVTAPYADVDHEDIEGHPRAACAFDTPSLLGIASSPPYLHDGSAATLRDVVERMPGAPSSDDDLAALVEYLRGL